MGKSVGSVVFANTRLVEYHEPVSGNILRPLVILSMEKTMVVMEISELKSVCKFKVFPETGPRSVIMMRSITRTVHA